MLLVSAAQLSESVTHIHISTLVQILTPIDHYRVLSRVPCAIQYVLIGTYFIYSSVYTTHSSALAWRIPWTEEPGGLQSMGS